MDLDVRDHTVISGDWQYSWMMSNPITQKGFVTINLLLVTKHMRFKVPYIHHIDASAAQVASKVSYLFFLQEVQLQHHGRYGIIGRGSCTFFCCLKGSNPIPPPPPPNYHINVLPLA
jgi:hypothetical protein